MDFGDPKLMEERVESFVRGQLQDTLVFPGYAQEDWVRAGQYQEAPWDDLVELWRTFNLQIARVMAATPDEVRRRDADDRHRMRVDEHARPDDVRRRAEPVRPVGV